MAVATSTSPVAPLKLPRSPGPEVLQDSSAVHEIPVQLALVVTREQRRKLLESLTTIETTPKLEVKNNVFRRLPSDVDKESYRSELLRGLRKRWRNPSTECDFLKFVKSVEEDGCIAFAGLIDAVSFTILVERFSHLMASYGRSAFLHSFLNLADHEEFLTESEFNNAFLHPLMICVISYLMGGPIRMTDIRGKDNEPMAVKAQDNMLHIDNTPFRQEFKILLAWEKGSIKGPTGQNFTFLPGTHKGNRSIRFDDKSRPWSTENDSIFTTKDALSDLFEFQRDLSGTGPNVVEIEYPARPVSIVFNAGALVHHRYRLHAGNSRSCIIAAFHLVTDNPGSLNGNGLNSGPSTLPYALLRAQDSEGSGFMSRLLEQAALIEEKIQDLNNPEQSSKCLDLTKLRLSGESLTRWMDVVVNAPSTSSLKLTQRVLLSSHANSMSVLCFAQRLTEVMSYDKHGLLDLILYHDGREEARKPARKRVWTMTSEFIAKGLRKWLLSLQNFMFDLGDIKTPAEIQASTRRIVVHLLRNATEAGDANTEHHGDRYVHESYLQLILDLGESITRCEHVETFISTILFIFWTFDYVYSNIAMTECVRGDLERATIESLRCYISCVLLTEEPVL